MAEHPSYRPPNEQYPYGRPDNPDRADVIDFLHTQLREAEERTERLRKQRLRIRKRAQDAEDQLFTIESIIANHPKQRLQTAGLTYVADDLRTLIDREIRVLGLAEAERDRYRAALEEIAAYCRPIFGQDAGNVERIARRALAETPAKSDDG